MCLHGEQDEKRHHQTKETHSLRQGKSQDGIREELLLQGGVPAEGHVEKQLMSLQTKDLHKSCRTNKFHLALTFRLDVSELQRHYITLWHC